MKTTNASKEVRAIAFKKVLDGVDGDKVSKIQDAYYRASDAIRSLESELRGSGEDSVEAELAIIQAALAVFEKSALGRVL